MLHEVTAYLSATLVKFATSFDLLRDLLVLRPITAANYSIAALENLLAPCADLDPAGDKYEASGIGRSEIRRDLKQAIDLVDKEARTQRESGTSTLPL